MKMFIYEYLLRHKENFAVEIPYRFCTLISIYFNSKQCQVTESNLLKLLYDRSLLIALQIRCQRKSLLSRSLQSVCMCQGSRVFIPEIMWGNELKKHLYTTKTLKSWFIWKYITLRNKIFKQERLLLGT